METSHPHTTSSTTSANATSTSISTSTSTVKKKDHHSIDRKHQEIMNVFKVIEEDTIPSIEQEIKELIDKRNRLSKHRNDDAYFDTKDKIKQLKKKVADLKVRKKKYLLENAKYIFHYYEDKQKVSNGDNVLDSSTVHQFFRIKSNTENGSDINSEKYRQSKKMYQEYWKNVNGDIMNLQEYVLNCHNCLICNQGELVPLEEEGVLICNNVACGKFIMNIVDNQKPLNKEIPNEVSYTAYIRLNHFKEILSQFQAKETTKIPDEVINAIRNRIVKERKDPKKLNYADTRSILSILGHNKYFEHIQYINSLLGIKPPTMNEELHETLCVLFIEIQKPWALFCPSTRTNFFNYTYILCQLCVLLDQKHYLPYIPMMKDRIKQLEQDMIWKKVCGYLDWEYFPTV